MKYSRPCLTVAALAAILLSLNAPAEPLSGFEVLADGQVALDGQVFPSMGAYFTSGAFRDQGRRCGTVMPEPGSAAYRNAAQSDCALRYTDPDDIYGPLYGTYRIPVVVHVIHREDGAGYVSPERVQSQIDILNEDYLALPGSMGALGVDARIEFHLALTDPDGQPASGITYTANDAWYADQYGYQQALAWDVYRYLNIYVNTAGGYLGYAYFPQDAGILGAQIDGVVINHEAFGRGEGTWEPYHLGRTTTHEVGHYLGLWHPFTDGCEAPADAPACYETGDTICDTLPTLERYGCPEGIEACGAVGPIHNYMSYTDDACMSEFTPEQVRRMRCTLASWRVALPEFDRPAPTVPVGNGTQWILPLVLAALGIIAVVPIRRRLIAVARRP